MEHGLVTDIAVCIITAWAVAVACHAARQPLLLAYLVAGFVIGPRGFRWVTEAHSIETISGIGLVLLLFMIGLEIDLKKMLNAGKVITLTALSQILGCVALGWLFFEFIGPAGSRLEAFYLAVAAAMSSTVIIVKILYDKRELETLAGRVTLGVLVLQDIAIILFLALQPNLKNPAIGLLALALGKVLLLVAVAYIAGRFLLPPVFKLVARLPELVLVGALAWCFAMAGLAGELGLSREMGALVAGMMISTFPYTLDVVAKVTSIRDFFVTLFFVGLGMTIPMPTWNFLLWMIVFSLLPIVMEKDGKARRICLLGFSWTASSLLEEITREKPALVDDLLVVDFNPLVYDRLRQRGVHVLYGDITQREVLHHAGVPQAEVIICSLPNTVLKGSNNQKLLRQLRELNPKAQIVVHAEKLSDIPELYAGGANYVTVPRLLEAHDLLKVVEAAEKNLLEEKRKEQVQQLEERTEVIP